MEEWVQKWVRRTTSRTKEDALKLRNAPKVILDAFSVETLETMILFDFPSDFIWVFPKLAAEIRDDYYLGKLLSMISNDSLIESSFFICYRMYQSASCKPFLKFLETYRVFSIFIDNDIYVERSKNQVIAKNLILNMLSTDTSRMKLEMLANWIKGSKSEDYAFMATEISIIRSKFRQVVIDGWNLLDHECFNCVRT
jgi:hypothetical protein